jgi:hypothetical protein
MAFRAMAVFALIAAVAFAGDPPKGPSDKDAKARVDALKAAKDNDAKKKAIADAAKCPHASVAAALGDIVCDSGDGLQVAAADALGEMKGLADAAKALAKGVSAKNQKDEVLKAIFSAMGKVGDAAAVPALKDFALKQFKDEKASSELFVANVEALAAIKCKASVDALLEILKFWTPQMKAKDAKKGKYEFTKAEGGLKAMIPGLPKELGGDEVGVWWEKNKASYNDDLTVKK